MAALPLTDQRWSGLPLLMCDMDPGLYRIEVNTSMLVIRNDPGTKVEVLDAGTGRRVFRQAPHRFDLFSSGLLMNAVSDRVATKSLVVALPQAWLPVDDGRPDRRLGLRPRFQFSDQALHRLVWRLSTHHRSGEPLGQPYNEAVSRAIVDRLADLQLGAVGEEPGREILSAESRRLVIELIDASLDQPPSAVQLASTLGIGQVRFARAFRATFKTTLHQYIQQRRLLRARQMLRDTDGTLSTIAMETGFSSHAHFTTVFRAVTGMTPSHYRAAAASGLQLPHSRRAK